MLSDPSRGLKGVLKARKEQGLKRSLNRLRLIADPFQIDRGLRRVDSFFLGKRINEAKELNIDQSQGWSKDSYYGEFDPGSG